MNWLVLLFAAAVVLVWMLIPLLVAVVIYRLAPDKVVTAKGPLQGLNIKAHGPFAIYVVVLLGSAPIWWKAFDVTIGMSKTKWTVTARVTLIDREKNAVSPDTARRMEPMHVKFDFPQAVVSGHDRIAVPVPGTLGDFPDLVIHVPKFGERIIYLNEVSGKAARIDHATSTVELDDQIVITEPQTGPIGVGMQSQ